MRRAGAQQQNSCQRGATAPHPENTTGMTNGRMRVEKADTLWARPYQRCGDGAKGEG